MGKLRTFTVERTYWLPKFQHVTLEAANPEEAARKALAQESWDGAKFADDDCKPEYVSGLWEAEEAYTGQPHPIPGALRETPATAPGADLSALLFNAACLWEAAEDMANRANAYGHEGAKAFRARAGACEARETIAGLALEVEAAWNGLSDDARDGWACPFDWEFVPAWLARRMGWEAGDPCEDPRADSACGQCEGTGTIEGGLGGDGPDEMCPVCDGSGELPA